MTRPLLGVRERESVLGEADLGGSRAPILEYLSLVEMQYQVEILDMANQIGIDLDDVKLGLRGLADAGYIRFEEIAANRILIEPALLERGRREIGQWPADASYAAFIAALENQIAEASGPERTRLDKLLDVAVDVGSTVISKVLRDVVAGG
jgi:hypothetical protein